MLLTEEIRDIFLKVQQCSSTHQKSHKVLCNLYNKHSQDVFVETFKEQIKKLVLLKHTPSTLFRLLDFCSAFIVSVSEESNKLNLSQEELLETSTHPFLAEMFNLALQYHDHGIPEVRYRACIFITSLLKHLGDGFLDNDICDKIEEAMLERIIDLKASIRSQAIIALARLQDPSNPECPVLRAFIGSFNDPSPTVRKHVVEVVGISGQTVSKILEKLRDVDAAVRVASYERCLIIEPKYMKIEQRQTVIHSGFKEDNKRVKNSFLNKLLPKWLSCYNGDYLQLLKAVKLDAYETDFEMTEFLNTNLLEVFFKTNPINEIMEYLPINEYKNIPLEKLTTEAAIFWRVLVNYLRRNVEEFIDQVIPELPSFCDYIYSYHKENTDKKLEVWEFFEFQSIMANLLLILTGYDFSDEAGRNKVLRLIETLLSNIKCSPRVIDELMKIYIKLTPNIETLTNEVSVIISNIREPLVEQGPTEQQIHDKEFQVAQLRYRTHVLMENQSEAVKKQDFEGAALIKNEIISIKQQIDEIETNFEERIKKSRVTRDETAVNHHVLNVLISMFKSREINKVTTAIMTLKNELILPFLQYPDPDTYCRTIECLALCCMLDFNWAEEHLKPILNPLIHYRVISTLGKKVVLTSIRVLSDLALLYGAKLFKRNSSFECTNGDLTASNISVRRLANKSRRLYTINDTEELDSLVNRCLTLDELIESLLDMLDDDQEDIRYCAGQGLCNLLRIGIINSSSIIARLCLKWFSPVTEKTDLKLQQLIGFSLIRYAQKVRGSEEIFEGAVIPILSSIANAPCTSPLVDIDIDNTLRYLSALIGIRKSTCIVNQHLKLARTLCHKIQTRPQDSAVPFYTKMLLCLEPTLEDPVVIQELLQQVDHLLKEIPDKAPSRYLKKFKTSLTNLTNSTNSFNNRTETTMPSECILPSVAEEVELSSQDEDNNENLKSASESEKTESINDKTNRKSVRFQFHSKSNNQRIEENLETQEPEQSKRKTPNDNEICNSIQALHNEGNDNEVVEAATKKSKTYHLKKKNANEKSHRLESSTGNGKEISEKKEEKYGRINNQYMTRRNASLTRKMTEESENSNSNNRTPSSEKISDVSSNTVDSTTSRMSELNMSKSVKRKKLRSRRSNDNNDEDSTMLETIVYDDNCQLEETLFSDEEFTSTPPLPSNNKPNDTVFSDEEESVSTTNTYSSVQSDDRRAVILTETSTDSEGTGNGRRSKRLKKFPKKDT
ncbi:condensin complex subunit 3 [Agrilus planipennis]|uniref:Condensin complex subunit 3 n=1 Tax=Agrilus planipennis TaxID=224129 RepID=A0A1W4WE27_AGRPL|nr:condensin complex subunit 3 [Agrilus planipennis]